MLIIERLKEVLNYNSFTGFFTWKITRRGRKNNDGFAGRITNYGYIQIGIDGKVYAAHRLAWFYMTGKWPENEIDHIDGTTYHNWIDNLREATSRENKYNSTYQKKNKTKMKGVCFHHNKYEANIKTPNKIIYLGVYNTAEEAKKAYEQEAIKLHRKYKRIQE